MIYKVWIHVEEIDEQADHYEDITEPVDIGGEFNTRAEAEVFAETIADMANDSANIIGS